MKKPNEMNVMPEWLHKIDADDVRLTPICTTISASPQERKDLARRLRVESIDFLEANLTLERASSGMMVHVHGMLRARVTQSCVVTLEPVPQEIEAPVEGWFADTEHAVPFVRLRHEKQGQKAGAELPMLEEEDDPEPFIEGHIDLGELVVQHLSLALDPYPHKEGAVFEEGEEISAAASEIRKNPFAALKNWKMGKNKTV